MVFTFAFIRIGYGRIDEGWKVSQQIAGKREAGSWAACRVACSTYLSAPAQLPLLWTSSPTTPRAPPVRRSLMFQCPLPHQQLPTCPLEPSRAQVALHDHQLGSSPAGHPANSRWRMRPARQPPSMRSRGS
ncbi:uncharacterized protein [Dermacentor andersoni]|uniref:uncharacterized protein isoform X2 n=1 Tax=Dermacentor andersoni TaxID=34620 RepID=UPI002416DD16|nr:uncharacterized protein LOC129381850 isoform X2 [Dermacentor andersoni]